MEIEKINDRLIKVETGLGEQRIEITNIKEDVNDMKQHQVNSDNTISDIKEMTIILRESVTKQSETNDYIKEMIGEFKQMFEKIGCKQDDYEKINNDRYIEMIKENGKQNCEVKEEKIDELKNRKDSFRDWAGQFGIKVLEFAIAGGLITGVIFAILKIGQFIP